MSDKPDFSKITLPSMPSGVAELFRRMNERKRKLFEGMLGPRFELGELSSVYSEWYLKHGKSLIVKISTSSSYIFLIETGKETIRYSLADPDSIQNLRAKLEEIIEEEAEHGRVW
jgi:hypothetical protein